MNGGPSGIVLIVRQPVSGQTRVRPFAVSNFGRGMVGVADSRRAKHVVFRSNLHRCDYLTNARELSILLLSCN
jgi:hypothetical protein